MVIVKIKQCLHQDVFQELRKHLEEFFAPERVLVFNGLEVDFIFNNEGKRRCSYCGRLANDDTCEHCGAPA